MIDCAGKVVVRVLVVLPAAGGVTVMLGCGDDRGQVGIAVEISQGWPVGSQVRKRNGGSQVAVGLVDHYHGDRVVRGAQRAVDRERTLVGAGRGQGRVAEG